jgi:catechol 2,3-dioxygenase-like lactoylglutathione lyase family enzyme
MCHPPHSVHIVEQILADFRAGRESRAAFWITVRGRFVHIEYLALRAPDGHAGAAVDEPVAARAGGSDTAVPPPLALRPRRDYTRAHARLAPIRIGVPPVTLLHEAKRFALRHHAGLERGNASGEPVVAHLAEVATYVAHEVGDDRGAETLVAAAWLHDVVEDTAVTIDDLREAFGEAVAAIVEGLTDPPDFAAMPMAARKRRQAARVSDEAPEVRLVKLADQVANIRSVVEDPPIAWSAEDCRAYLDGAAAVAAACGGVSPRLAAWARRHHERGIARYGGEGRGAAAPAVEPPAVDREPPAVDREPPAVDREPPAVDPAADGHWCDGIDTVLLRVHDLDAAAAWYETKLGLPRTFADPGERLVVFGVGGATSLTLWALKPGEVPPSADAARPFPIFRVPDARRAWSWLRRRGVAVGELAAANGVTSFQFRDPDGNVLEACQVG